jgi:hypothetical protein
MTDVARDWLTIGIRPYSQLRSIFLFFAARLSSAKSQCRASPVVVQTEFGFQIVPMRLIWRLGSENVPMSIKSVVSDEVTGLNPPVVSLPDDVRANANTACTEFSKRWTCKRSP